MLVLVKALPHVGEQHGETVCCAGITPERQWRRLFPIPFRRLKDAKFARWNWVEYEWRTAFPKDRRPESRRVQESSLKVDGELASSARSRFLDPIVVRSVDEAASRGQTLALIRPRNVIFRATLKSSVTIADERRAYALAASQGSFLDEALRPLDPCPFAFHFSYQTADQKNHLHVSDDWETSAMFYRFSSALGQEGALQRMKEIFEIEYPKKGMAFALGTHSRRPKQWLLVGILRLDEERQISLI